LTENKFRLCPRSRLQEIEEIAEKQRDIEFLVGLEIEFSIMDNKQPIDHVVNAYSTASLRNKSLSIMEEIVHVLHQSGIVVRQFHSEGGHGLFEISTEPSKTLQAVDDLIYSCESIKTICAKVGLQATMFPKPFDFPGTAGLHYHISMSPVQEENCFLSGILGSWPALAAFIMPNFDSYSRVRQGQSVC